MENSIELHFIQQGDIEKWLIESTYTVDDGVKEISTFVGMSLIHALASRVLLAGSMW